MKSPTKTEAIAVLRAADCIYDETAVEQALDVLATEITASLGEANPLIVCVLIGALVPFGKLIARLKFPLELDYIHATRYRGDLHGKELRWLSGPYSSPEGRPVLIVDDILDEGITLAGIEEYFQKAGAQAVYKAVLIQKDRPRDKKISADFVGLEVPDRYVFGYGMDYKGYWRNLSGIYAVAAP